MALFAYETLNIKVTSKVWMGVIKYTCLFTLIEPLFVFAALKVSGQKSLDEPYLKIQKNCFFFLSPQLPLFML